MTVKNRNIFEKWVITLHKLLPTKAVCVIFSYSLNINGFVMPFLRILLLLLLALMSCTPDDDPMLPPPVPEKVDILALGDSYTKGQGVDPGGNFPSQLADSLRQRGVQVTGVRSIAQSGWRTDQLLANINSSTDIRDSLFSLVTLCIGVNNQFQNKDTAVYRAEFELILQKALVFAGNRKDRVVVLSIPDWAYTPYGQGSSNPANISKAIDVFNAINVDISTRYKVLYVNVTGISRQGVAQPDLVATDQLHPSAKQYTLWIREMLPRIPL
jgi:lysophospholipase L1-like esterase